VRFIYFGINNIIENPLFNGPKPLFLNFYEEFKYRTEIDSLRSLNFLSRIYERSFIVVQFKSAQNWIEILATFPNFFGMIVAGYYQLLWSDEHRAPLGLCAERVVVAPQLHVMRTYLIRAHLLDDHYVLVVVTIPPLVVALDVRTRVAIPYRSGLACTGRSVVPLVNQLCSVAGFCAHDSVQVNASFELLKLFQGNDSVINCLDNTFLEDHLVSLGN